MRSGLCASNASSIGSQSPSIRAAFPGSATSSFTRTSWPRLIMASRWRICSPAIWGNSPALSRRHEYQRPRFDAFPWQNLSRRAWIIEGCVGREARPGGQIRIEAFEEDGLALRHLGIIVPAMVGAVVEAIGLSGPIAIDKIGGDAVRRRDRAGVTD